MIKAPPTPKGFRDVLPELAKKRREVIGKIADVLEKSGFVSVETPTIEFAETLKGKYGEEERLIYEFTDRGGRNLALRYDLTVPLARFVASNLNLIAKGPFRRYQIGQVFRGENPQRGRFREFTQFDFDIVGPAVQETPSKAELDAEIISTVIKCLDSLGLNKYRIKINDKTSFFESLNKAGIKDDKEKLAVELDKSDKKPQEDIFKTLASYSTRSSLASLATIAGPIKSLEDYSERGTASTLYNWLRNTPRESSTEKILNELVSAAKQPNIVEYQKQYNNPEGPEFFKNIKSKIRGDKSRIYYDRNLARGLNYYTGVIFEVVLDGYSGGSVGGGGRYDNLVGMFAKRDIPAVGFSFGLDRLVEALV